MIILEKFLKILPKFSKKEEISQNPVDLEIADAELQEDIEVVVEPNPNIIYRYKRIRTPLSHYIKQVLRWLNLKNQFGEELIKEEDDVNLIFSYWSKSILIWIFSILVTGLLIYIAILPFYSVPFILIPFTIFSFGLIYFIFIETLKEIKKAVGGKRG